MTTLSTCNLGEQREIQVIEVRLCNTPIGAAFVWVRTIIKVLCVG